MAQHEAATATRPLETLLQKVGDLRGRAGDGGGVARRRLQSMFEKILERDFAVVAQRLRKLLDEADRRCVGGDDALVQFAQRETRGQRRHIESGVVREPDTDGLAWYAVNQALAHAPGLRLGLADHDLRGPDDADLVRVTAFRAQGRVYLSALLGHGRDRLARTEDVVDEPRRRARATRRAASLDQNRDDLRRWRHAERAFHLEESPDVIDRPNLVWVGDQPGLAIPFERVWVHAPPQRLADVHELVHTVVALAMLHQLIEAVVLRIRLALRGDDIERNAPVRDVVK